MSQKAKCRVAVAGCHRMLKRQPAGHNWASAFAAVPETEIVAVFDRGDQTRQQFLECWGKMPAYDDYEKMLREIHPDIVCVTTRQTMHANQIEAAVEYGARGILCEKPLATSLFEADRIVTLCKTKRIPLVFGLDRRWWTTYRFLRDWVRQGEIGQVTGAVAYALPNLINHGCHWFDTLLMLVGDPEPQWVSGLVEDVSNDPPESSRRLDPAGSGPIGLPGGIAAFVTPMGKPGVSFEILGDKGRLLILDDTRAVYVWSASPGSQPGLRRLELPGLEEGWPAGPAAVRDLLASMETGQSSSCDADHARRATEISFAFHESSELGGARVSLPLTQRHRTIKSFPWGNE